MSKNKNITFHINQEAYTIDLGPDEDNALRKGITKFLTTEKNLSTAELLLAYLRKTQELVTLEKQIAEEIGRISSFETLNSTN